MDRVVNNMRRIDQSIQESFQLILKSIMSIFMSINQLKNHPSLSDLDVICLPS